MNISENSIVWSGKEFLLKDFIETFPLPQIIKVEEGYHDQFEEDRTLSASQLLTLHSVKELAIVKALATEKSLEMLLPADSESKVSIINRSDGPEYYDTVEDLASGFPKFATSANNFQCFGISATDVLELKKKVKKHRENYLVCNVVGKNRTVEIPFSFKARFKALGNCPSVSPTLEDVVKCCELPCTVRFMDSKLKLHRNGFEIERPLGFNALGPIKLISLSHYKVVFTTTWEDQNTNVLPLPIDLEVRIVAALGAIQNDKTYSKLCKIAQDKTESEKLVLKFIRHGPCKVLMENIESQPVNDEEGTSYSEIGPKLLPRNYKTQRRPAPTPKPRTKSAPTEVLVNKKPLSSPTKQMQDHDVFNDNESCISVSNSGRTQGFSLNLQNLPPSKDEMEAETNLPNLASGESRNILRASSKKLGQIFSPLKKVPSKVGSEVKKRISKRSSPIPDLSSSSALSSAYSTGSSSSASSSSASSSSASSSSASSSSASSSSASSSSASSSGANRAEARSEYREVKRLPGCSADRLNLELLNAINIKTKNNLRDKLNVENPKDVQSWSIRDVAEVLRFCHLEMYIEKFKEEKIDGVLLLSLDDEALTSLGVEDSLHQTKLLKIIGGWLPKM